MSFVGLVIIAAVAWLALVVASRVDELFFEGQSLPVGPFSALPGVDDEGPSERITVLVMGLDRRPSEGESPTRTDTMFVLTIDPSTSTAGIVGIPRDSWVEIPTRDGSGSFESRINTAFAIGETEGYSGGGANLAMDVTERALGIPIDHYLIIDFEGFKALIDELGGVDVFVEEEINDPFYSETELPGDFTPLHFEPGLQHMDGQTALNYSRTRYDSSDLDRIHRQQQIIFAAIDETLEKNLVDFDNLLGLWGKYKDAFDTDINDFEAPNFARLATRIDSSRIYPLSIGYAATPWTTPDGAQVLLIDKDLVRAVVDAVFTDPELAEEAALVEVQNGAGTDGLAAQVVNYLQQFGFEDGAIRSADAPNGSVLPMTEIVDFTGKDHTVEKLASLLEVPSSQVRTAGPSDDALRTVTGADIVVVLGADAQTRDFSVESESPDG